MSLLNTARRQAFGLLKESAAQPQLLHVAGSRSICFSCAGKILRKTPATTTRQVIRQGNRQAVRYLATGKPLLKVRTRGYAAVALEAQQLHLEDDHHQSHFPPQQRPSEKLGPLDTYERSVAEGKLKDDEFQRGIVRTLQNLHDQLALYKPPNVVHPTLESLTPKPKGLFSSLFNSSKDPNAVQFPEDTPRGLYLYGDVGCGKTMLMDLFYDTLPENIESKKRIHFHHFMQDVHKRLHQIKMKHGNDFDAIPFVAAEIADEGKVLCFDEFQCTDVADAMILRRLLECLLSHGVVPVLTSNRHPDDLYKNGIQRQSFIPCIELLKNKLIVVPLDSNTDYRKVPRPAAGVYHHPLNKDAIAHANKWFAYLGDPNDPPHPETHHIWGRAVKVPLASGRAAKFSFKDLCGSPLSAADYLELTKWYTAFIITDIPQMSHKQRDLARRFITFIDAVYESKARLVITSEVPLAQLFVAKDDLKASGASEEELDSAMRNLMDDLGLNMQMLKSSAIFSGDEERFAFARALSRLSEMGGVQWLGN